MLRIHAFIRRAQAAGVDGVHRDAVGIRGLGNVLDLRSGVEGHSFEQGRSGLPSLFASDFVDQIEHLAAGLHLKPFGREYEDFFPLDARQSGHQTVE
jgi:hypothetical protein